MLDKWRTMANITQEVKGTLLWLMPRASTDRWLEPPGDRHPGAPVPGRGDGDVAAALMDKLKAIREQLAGDMGMADGPAATDDDHGQHDEDGAQLARIADVARTLHGLACGVEMAIWKAEAAQRDSQEGGDMPHLIDRLMAAVDRVGETTQTRLRHAAAAHKSAKLEGWRAWVAENLANGARNAHKYLKLPVEWRPTTSLTVDGVLTAEPRKLLENYAGK